MSDTKGKIVELDLNDILPNRLQPRIKFNEEAILELSESIKVHGVLQPIIVRPISDKYEIIAGERRYKASVIAGLETIPAMIIAYNDKDSAEVALIENVQRKDLTSIEEAISYKKILDMGYLTQEQLASKLGKSQSAIANKIRLLNLCDDVQEALMEEKISERHARSLLKLKNKSSQRYLLKRIIKERLTVRKTDDEIAKILSGEISIEIDDDDIEENINNNAPKTDNIHKLEKEDSSENVVSKEDDSDSDFDITDFFNEKELDEFLKIISEGESEDKKEKGVIETETEQKKIEEDLSLSKQHNLSDEILIQEEKEERDSMINDYQSENNQSSQGGKFFTTVNNDVSDNNSFFKENDNLSTTSNKINDLMAPEGSKNLFNSNANSVQDTIFSSVNTNSQSSKDSMFSDLMKNQDNQQDNGFVDGDTFGKFLDPSYVDGAKKEVSQDSVVDSSVFAKFLDKNYDSKQESSNIFGGMNSKQFIQTQPIVEDNSVIDKQPTISEPSDDNKFSFLLSAENSSPKESINTPVRESNIDMNPIDLLKSDSMIDTPTKVETTENPSLSEINITKESKPDLLAPMDSGSNNVPNLLEPMSKPINDVNTSSINPFSTLFRSDASEAQKAEEDISSISTNNSNPILFNNSVLTPDTSLTNKEEVTEPVIDQISPVPTSLDHPIFVTASSPTMDTSMPTTPIIDTPDTSKLLSSNISVEPEESVTQEETEPVTIAESIQPEPEIEIPGPVSNQTIIVTDYNKQYDPIFPDTLKTVEPQIDMKNIIGMIRDLGNKIEQFGYSIDLDEIDLTDSYQVIFNIIKK